MVVVKGLTIFDPDEYVYVDAPLGNIVKLCPAKITPELTVIVGVGLTVKFIVLVEVHPEAFIELTVYTALDIGLTDMDAPVNGPGVHVYEEKPLAVNVAFEPGQIELEEAETPNTGLDIIISLVLILMHPKAFAPVTV